MLKKILGIGGLLILISALIFGAVNRTQAKSSSDRSNRIVNTGANLATGLPESETPQNASGLSNGNGGGQRGASRGDRSGDPQLALAEPTSLDPSEADALAFMLEEEKLAHDLYITFFQKWGTPAFQNIALSEQSHMDAIKFLMDRYGLPGTASETAGVFNNPDLQALYNKLSLQGSQSLELALEAAALVEEIDILDLEERLVQTDNPDIQQVFNRLLSGSGNHLYAFVLALQMQGVTYQPQELTPEAYQAIIGNYAGNGAGRQSGQPGKGYRGGRP